MTDKDKAMIKRVASEVKRIIQETMEESDYRGVLRLDIDLETGRVNCADYF